MSILEYERQQKSIKQTATPDDVSLSSNHEESLNNLSPGWRFVRIGDLTVKTKQRNPGRAPEEKFTYVDVSAVSNTSFRVVGEVIMNGAEAPSRARKVIHAGDVIFATVRPTLKRVAMVSEALHGQICSTGYIVLRTNPQKLGSQYLYYWLLTDRFISRMRELQRGASYPAVRDSDILDEQILLPSLSEQQKIAHVLGVVQQAIEHQERLIATTAELKKTLLQQLFTKGLRGEPQKPTEIGLVPESWEIVNLCSVAASFTYGTSIKCGYDTIGKPVLRIPNVEVGSINVADVKYGNPKPSELGTLKLKADDLLFVRTNGVQANAGRCAIFRDELQDCYFASYLIRVRVDEGRLAPDFLNAYAQSEQGISYLSGKAIRTADGKFNINTGTLKAVMLPLPSLREQIEIVEMLGTADQKFDLHCRYRATLTTLFHTLLHQVMAAEIKFDNFAISLTGNS